MKRQPGARRQTPATRAPLRLPNLRRPDGAGRLHLPATTPAANLVAADRAVAQGVPLHQAGRLAEAEACYRQALAVAPDHPDALHLLGLLAHQVGRPEIAVALIRQAIAVTADRPAFYLNLGAALQAQGQLAEAVIVCRQALALRPAYPEALNNLGVMLQALGRVDEAIPCFERAIALLPAYADAHFNLGAAFQADRQPERAVEAYRAALALRPAYPAALYNLGNTLCLLEQYAPAADAYEAVLALEPDHVQAHNNLGVALQALGERDRALVCFERTLQLDPAYTQADTNRAHLWRDRGRLDEASAVYRRVLAADPTDAQAHSCLLLVLDHQESVSAEQALAERRAWNLQHARALTLAAPPHPNDRTPARRLRVGYVSGDFYYHSASTAFLEIILNHDPSVVEAVCYATVAKSDAQTERIKSLVPRWRDITHLTDAEAAEQIRADEIDILVDLGGHSASGRLLIFAHKPAPVQVTAWGYVTGTGLDAMDYVLADPVVVPPDAERWYQEQVVHLPCFVTYGTVPHTPDIVPPPVLSRGTVTLGSFNRSIKITELTLDLWGRVLAAMPEARLLLKSPGLDDDDNRTRILAGLGRQGVAPARVEILGRTPQSEHLAAYGQIDIQLDPFPHGGGATTFEGLMQGVPCVTLLGDRISGRVSASLLGQVGLEDLVAGTPEQYVEIVQRLAADPARLARERETLRQRVLASPMGNGPVYTRAVERVYRDLWERWRQEGMVVR
ncbi:MAG: tetratricopeptide repeat protein [Chloroflexi bacterium]|nr:tetratricopeptide repeat protein [Chloroflexota bacterium]